MPTTDDNSAAAATTSCDSDGALSQPQPLTVEEAAGLLGVSPRTIQRRCQSGKLSANQVQGEFGEVWEIDRQAVEQMASKEPRQAATDSDDRPRQGGDTATTSDDNSGDTATTGHDSVAAIDDATDDGDRAKQRDHQGDAAPDFRAKYIAELENANGFLKSQLEDSNRNAAELRAALRESLRAMPRQLEAGTPPNANAAPETRQNLTPIADPTDASTKTMEAAQLAPSAKAVQPEKMPRPLWKVVLGIR